MNGQDIAAVIGAVCVGIPVVGGFVLQVMTYRRQALRDALVAEIKTQVDGLGEKREAMALRAGQAEGHLSGVAEEVARNDPLGAAAKPPVAVVVIADSPIPVVVK